MGRDSVAYNKPPILTLAKVSLRQVWPAYRSNTPIERNLYHGICSSERWTAIDADRAAWESLPDVKIRDGKSHKEMSNGTVILPKNIKRGMKFKDAAFMGIMRWAFYNALKEQYEPAIPVSMTYGYLTKNTRIRHNLPKEHHIDARCISGNPDAVSDGTYYYQKKVRCHNRQIHKQTILKGGIRKSNQAEYLVKGYRLFDKVRYHGREYFIFGRRKTGFFDIRTLSGEKVNKGSISVKKLTFADTKKNYLTERRTV